MSGPGEPGTVPSACFFKCEAMIEETRSVVELYAREHDIEIFRKKVIALEGDFPFDSGTMVEMGRIYFERHPDRFSGRDMDEVHEGYAVVRICAVEKMLACVDRSAKFPFREIFMDVGRAGDILADLVRNFGREKILEYHRRMTASLKEIKAVIDEIPKSMIKERFIGGISSIFNVMYIIKMILDKG